MTAIFSCFKDGDGKLNLKEYVINVFGDTENMADWELGKAQFQQFRDKNKDGAIDKHELKVSSVLVVQTYEQRWRKRWQTGAQGKLEKDQVLAFQG